MTDSRPIRVRVHERGDERLDAVLRLLDKASGAASHDAALQALCRDVARILGADVVSVYVRETAEEGEVLVMRANVGFPRGAVGRVRLRMGEGITGFVAEHMRPASLAMASSDGHYEHVPGLGEERFPAFAAIPLPVDGRAAGVLVLQRRASLPFAGSEVLLASALALAFVHVLGRRRASESPTAARIGSRGARLEGDPLSGGRAYGRAVFLKSLEVDAGDEHGGSARAEGVTRTLERVTREVRAARRALGEKLSPEVRRHLAASALLLDDRRFVDRMLSQVSTLGLGAGLRQVARDYARHAVRASASDQRDADWLGDRSEEVEDLCAIVRDGASGRSVLRRGAVLVLPDRLTPLVALVASARHVGAVVVGGEVAAHAPGAEVARAARIPTVGHVEGLFAWTRPGDPMLVDGGKGVVLIDPPERAVARLKDESGPQSGAG